MLVISNNSDVGLKSSYMGNDIIYGVNAPDKTNTKTYIASTYYDNDQIPYILPSTGNISENRD